MAGGVVSQFWAVGARHRIWAEFSPCRWMEWPGKTDAMKPATDEEESGGGGEGDTPAGWPGSCERVGSAFVRCCCCCCCCCCLVVVMLLAVSCAFSACRAVQKNLLRYLHSFRRWPNQAQASQAQKKLCKDSALMDGFFSRYLKLMNSTNGQSLRSWVFVADPTCTASSVGQTCASTEASQAQKNCASTRRW